MSEHGYTTDRHRFHPTLDFDVRQCPVLARRLHVLCRRFMRYFSLLVVATPTRRVRHNEKYKRHE